MTDASSIGRLLAETRLEAGISQMEVAARMRTTQSAVSRAERGRTLPTLDFLERYARAIGEHLSLRFVEGGRGPAPGEVLLPPPRSFRRPR